MDIDVTFFEIYLLGLGVIVLILAVMLLLLWIRDRIGVK